MLIQSLTCSSFKYHDTFKGLPSFFNQTLWLLFYFHFVQLLLAGSIYFFGKRPDAWYGTYKWDGDNCQMLSVVRTASQSCCQLWNDSYSTNSPNTSVLTIGRNYLQTCSHATYTSWRLLFEHGIYFVQSFWLCDYYPGEVTTGEQHLF